MDYKHEEKQNTIHPTHDRQKQLEPLSVEAPVFADRNQQESTSGSNQIPSVLPPIQSNSRAGLSKQKQPIKFHEEAKDVSNERTGTSVGSPSGSPKGEKRKITVWSEDKAFREFPTNGFGKLEFANDEARSKPAKYIRLSDTTPSEKLLELMISKWRMQEPHRPSLAISVIGGAKNFNLDGKKKEIFSRGLVKGCWPATYHVDPVIRHGRPVSLDPNHTHFILVDDGYRNVFRPQVADFRAKLERHIAAPILSASLMDKGKVDLSGGLGIPVVVILVEGGLDSVEFAYESLKCRIPLVLCQGTGRAADILSFAFNHHVVETDEKGGKRRLLPEHQKGILLEKLKAAYGKIMKGSKKHQAEKLNEKIEQILRCCQEEDLITVFDIHRNEDFDLSILSALLKGRGATSLDQLRLALKWNRSDVAAEKLFTDAAVWQYGELDDIMTEALATNKGDFVRLLLQHGVVMKDYLTVRRLRTLYNHAGRGSFLRMLLVNASGGSNHFFLHHVKNVLENLLERTVEDVYSLDSDEATRFEQTKHETQIDEIMSPISEARFEKPFKELFLWAVLMNRPELARFFWERGDNPVIGALVATKVYDSLARMVQDANLDLLNQYKQHKKDFESLAISVIEHAFNADPEKALLVVEQPNIYMGNVTCLNIAAAAGDKIVIALLFPFIVIFRNRSFDSATLGIKRSEISIWQRLKVFYSAPVTKFCSFTMFYVLFLLLYTYVLLFNFRPNWSYAEIALHGWVATIVLNEIRAWSRACYHYYSTTDNYKRAGASLALAFWNVSIWSKMELIALVLHLLGFSLRWLPPDKFDITRVVFCLAVMLFYLRIMRVYMASSYLGPKLFVIRRMFKDVVMFLMILIVFMMAYAVASQALMFPVREFYWGILTDILYYPYWQIYGELSLDETIGGNLGGCEGNTTTNARGQYCPRKFWPVALFLAGYLLVGNILLVNLLIAIFTHVFEEVQANSTEIWKFELYGLATEFDHKPILPPPFTLFENLYSVIKWFCHKIRNKHDNIKTNICLSKKQRENLQIFEKECMNEFLHSMKAANSTEIGYRVRQILEKVEAINKRLEEENKQREVNEGNHLNRTLFSRSNTFYKTTSSSGSYPGTADCDFSGQKEFCAISGSMPKSTAKTTTADISIQCNLLGDKEKDKEETVERRSKSRSSNRSALNQQGVETEAETKLKDIQERLELLEKKAENINL